MQQDNDPIIFFNKESFEKEFSNIEKPLSLLRETVNIFNNLGLRKIENEQDAGMFLRDPENFVFDRMIEGKKMDFGGLEVNRDKLKELIQKPNEYEVIYTFILSATEMLNDYLSRHHDVSTLYEFFKKLCTLDKNGDIQVIDNVKKDIKRKNEIHIIDPHVKDVCNFLNEYMELTERYQIHGNKDIPIIDKGIKIDGNIKKINAEFLNNVQRGYVYF